MGIKDSSLWAREILSFLETAKNGSINGKQDCVWLKDIIFSDGSARVEPKQMP